MPSRYPLRKNAANRSKQKMARDFEKKFWLNVDWSGGKGACWPWKRGKTCGYGNVYLGGGRANSIMEYAHRLALFYKTGVFRRLSMHSCDNRACCNQGHLCWATHKQNSQDALKKGRSYIGEKNSNSVLSDKRVRQILSLRADGYLLREIAAIVGATVSNVTMVARRETWKHINAY
jgi:hypothetical protein